MTGLIAAILRLLLRLLGSGEPAAARDAERAGAAEAALRMEDNSEDAVHKAAAARDRVAAADARPDRLQHAVGADPDCRDC